jgi:RNA polymerase sigma-70 factor (ECF subfamily)
MLKERRTVRESSASSASSNSGLDERELVVRAAGGDGPAFGQLYLRYVDDVYAYIQLRVRNSSLAEDLTQDVFMNAYRGLPRFQWQGSLAPWLMRIAHNRVANHWRSMGRRPELVALPEDDPDDPRPELSEDDEQIASLLGQHVGAAEVERALSRLTDLQQQVIALRFGAGLSLLETADVMERTQNAVKNLQHNALVGLRRQLRVGEREVGA